MKNKKGFTLVELIVSFALITAISLAFFRTILSLQKEQLENIARNNFKAFTIVLNNSIQKDFLNDNIEKIISCGENCYDITYTANGIVRLSVDKENGTITYGNIKEKLPNDYKFIGNIEFTSYINSYEGNDSYIALNLNLKSNYESKIENIKYLYQYDSDNGVIELDVDGAEASDIIEYLLYTSSEENGLYEPLLPDGTSTGIRYRGSNPNNYVYFNCEDTYNNKDYGEDGYDYTNACEVWRIIGVFDVDNGKGNIEKRVKLVNLDSNFYASWDSSATEVNGGYGIPQWGESTYQNGAFYEGADLMRLLNGYYIKKENSECKYNNGAGQSELSQTCTLETLKTDKMKQITNISKEKIDSAVWYTSSIENPNWTDGLSEKNSVSSTYKLERANVTEKICNILDPYCNDTVKRTTEWTGMVGLIYPSDYGYASRNQNCLNNIFDNINNVCKNDNWLHIGKHHWTISSIQNYYGAHVAVYIISSGYVGSFDVAGNTEGIHPSLYLKPNVTFIGDGIGTEDKPYILGINE